MSVNPVVHIATTANTSALNSHVNDAAFENAKGSAAAEGDIYINTTLHVVRAYLSGAWTSQRFLIGPISKTADYTLTSNDETVFANADAGSSFTLTLPAAASNTGKIYKIVKTGSTVAKTITIDGNASETVGGSTTYVLYTLGEELEIVCDGSNWQVLSHRTNTDWVAYTPVGNMTTNATYTGFWRRVGDSIEVNAKIAFAGATDSTTASISWPSGLTFDSAKTAGGTGQSGALGVVNLLDSSAGFGYTGVVAYNSGVQVLFWGYDTGTWSNTVPLTIAASDSITCRFTVPISGWKA